MEWFHGNRTCWLTRLFFLPFLSSFYYHSVIIYLPVCRGMPVGMAISAASLPQCWFYYFIFVLIFLVIDNWMCLKSINFGKIPIISSGSVSCFESLHVNFFLCDPGKWFWLFLTADGRNGCIHGYVWINSGHLQQCWWRSLRTAQPPWMLFSPQLLWRPLSLWCQAQKNTSLPWDTCWHGNFCCVSSTVLAPR